MSRKAEMDRIMTRLKGPKPAAFVLAGAAGVGKSRLAAEAAKSAAGMGFATAEAVASRATASIPFGPFAPFLPETGHTPGDMLGLLRQAGDAMLARAGPDGRLLLVVARLVLSVRTVDNHLQNVYTKLGVTSRDELARTLRS